MEPFLMNINGVLIPAMNTNGILTPKVQLPNGQFVPANVDILPINGIRRICLIPIDFPNAIFIQNSQDSGSGSDCRARRACSARNKTS